MKLAGNPMNNEAESHNTSLAFGPQFSGLFLIPTIPGTYTQHQLPEWEENQPHSLERNTIHPGCLDTSTIWAAVFSIFLVGSKQTLCMVCAEHPQ